MCCGTTAARSHAQQARLLRGNSAAKHTRRTLWPSSCRARPAAAAGLATSGRGRGCRRMRCAAGDEAVAMEGCEIR